MRILLTGASGFIGGHLLDVLRRRGHQVRAAVRDPAALLRRLPDLDAIACDFATDVTVDSWLPRLGGVDAVINCVGVFAERPATRMQAINEQAPRALFDACVATGVRKVIQLSAGGADQPTAGPCGRARHAADLHLAGLPLDATVLRLSMVYGAGIAGPMGVARGLAGLPAVIPVINDGLYAVRPLHVDDLIRVVLEALGRDGQGPRALDAFGAHRTHRELFAELRHWLGIGPARFLPVPLPVCKAIARLGDRRAGGFNTAVLRHIRYGAAAQVPDWAFGTAFGFTPLSITRALAERPAETHDRWHARLFVAGPLLRVVLAAYWIVVRALDVLLMNALNGGLLPPVELQLPRLVEALASLLIGILVLARWRPALMAGVQCALLALPVVATAAMTVSPVLSVIQPLFMTLPLMLAIFIWALLDRRR